MGQTLSEPVTEKVRDGLASPKLFPQETSLYHAFDMKARVRKAALKWLAMTPHAAGLRFVYIRSEV